jgi:hypothetical protein
MPQSWYEYQITHGYIPNSDGGDTPHYAVDLGMPMGTPITAIYAGVVKIADYAMWGGQPGGGEVFVQPDGGGPQYYFYHLDEIAQGIQPGAKVAAGQLIGWSGGQNSGGNHPVSPMWSNGPHLHTGFFFKYVSTPIGSRPYGPDITPVIAQLRASGGQPLATIDQQLQAYATQSTFAALSQILPSGGGFRSMSEATHSALSNIPGFAGIAIALDLAEQFQGMKVPNNDIVVFGQDTGISNPLQAPQTIGGAVLETISANLAPALLRGGMILIGLVLLIGLLNNLGKTLLGGLEGFASGAGMGSGSSTAGAASEGEIAAAAV